MAVAVVGRAADYASVGIDIEPNEALDPDLVALVASPAEIRRYAPAVLQSRLLFVIKEATYKALFPLDKLFLDFSDIEVDLERLQTRTTQGRTTAVTLCVAAHIAALCVPI
jgi:4'-phosphopantetheinyl transferase EntD